MLYLSYLIFKLLRNKILGCQSYITQCEWHPYNSATKGPRKALEITSWLHPKTVTLDS